jgi:hypothetical protein
MKAKDLINTLGFTGIVAHDVATVAGVELHMFNYKDLDLEKIEASLGKPFMVGARILYKVGDEGTLSIAKRNKTVTFAKGLAIYNRAMSLPQNHPNYKNVVRN